MDDATKRGITRSRSVSSRRETRRALLDTLVPAALGLLLGAGAGVLADASRAVPASPAILLGSGAGLGTAAGVLVGAARGLRGRPREHRAHPEG